MKEGSHKKNSKSKKGSEWFFLLPFLLVASLSKFRVDKFSAGRIKCRSPMLKITWWNSLALFLIGNLQGVLKP